MPRANEEQFLFKVLCGRKDAVRFCQLLFRVSQVWDDLVDGDRQVAAEDINRAFWMLLVELPVNSFYNDHFSHLQPLLSQYICDWLDANELEKRGDDHGKNIAFVLRDGIGAIIIQCAYLLGGYDYMRKVSEEVRRHIFEEGLEKYKQERRSS